MKHFIYFSKSAVTSGKAISDNLMKAGRMDIAIHSLIQGIFLSRGVREDVKFHFIFYGMPDPPKHIEIQVKQDEGMPETGSKVQSLDLSKKDVASLIKKLLYKCKEGEKREVVSGCFIEKKNLFAVINELQKEGNQIFILDKKGEDLREVEIEGNCVFVLGDHDGLPKKELKRLKQIAIPVSVGPKTYFASQTVAIVNNELDRRNI